LEIKEEGVKKVAPCHCSGDLARKIGLLQLSYPNKYIIFFPKAEKNWIKFVAIIYTCVDYKIQTKINYPISIVKNI